MEGSPKKLTLKAPFVQYALAPFLTLDALLHSALVCRSWSHGCQLEAQRRVAESLHNIGQNHCLDGMPWEVKTTLARLFTFLHEQELPSFPPKSSGISDSAATVEWDTSVRWRFRTISPHGPRGAGNCPGGHRCTCAEVRRCGETVACLGYGQVECHCPEGADLAGEGNDCKWCRDANIGLQLAGWREGAQRCQELGEQSSLESSASLASSLASGREDARSSSLGDSAQDLGGDLGTSPLSVDTGSPPAPAPPESPSRRISPARRWRLLHHIVDYFVILPSPRADCLFQARLISLPYRGEGFQPQEGDCCSTVLEHPSGARGAWDNPPVCLSWQISVTHTLHDVTMENIWLGAPQRLLRKYFSRRAGSSDPPDQGKRAEEPPPEPQETFSYGGFAIPAPARPALPTNEEDFLPFCCTVPEENPLSALWSVLGGQAEQFSCASSGRLDTLMEVVKESLGLSGGIYRREPRVERMTTPKGVCSFVTGENEFTECNTEHLRNSTAARANALRTNLESHRAELHRQLKLRVPLGIISSLLTHERAPVG